MKICYLDAFSGISGDMTVGALIDAGAPSQAIFDVLSSFDTGAKYSCEKTIRGGVASTKFRVDIADAVAKHRHLSNIVKLIDASSLSDRAKHNAIAVFQRLGEAEARVHGVPVEGVHFHEVGAADSIADIAGACAALDLLSIDELHVSPINTGSGAVKTEHGVLPVPAPATAALLLGKPIYSRGPEVELTTPTGAALAVTLATRFGALPPLKISSIGYGAGDHDFKQQPNVLRAIIGESVNAARVDTRQRNRSKHRRFDARSARLRT